MTTDEQLDLLRRARDLLDPRHIRFSDGQAEETRAKLVKELDDLLAPLPKVEEPALVQPTRVHLPVLKEKP